MFIKHKQYHQILNEDGMTTSIETKKLTINIKKGYKEGTKIIFPNLGDQSPDTFPGNLYYNKIIKKS